MSVRPSISITGILILILRRKTTKTVSASELTLSGKQQKLAKTLRKDQCVFFSIFYTQFHLSVCGCTKHLEELEMDQFFILPVYACLSIRQPWSFLFNLHLRHFNDIYYTNVCWPNDENYWKWFGLQHLFNALPYNIILREAIILITALHEMME